MAPSNKHIVWFVLGCGVLVLAAPVDKTAQGLEEFGSSAGAPNKVSLAAASGGGNNGGQNGADCSTGFEVSTDPPTTGMQQCLVGQTVSGGKCAAEQCQLDDELTCCVGGNNGGGGGGYCDPPTVNPCDDPPGADAFTASTCPAATCKWTNTAGCTIDADCAHGEQCDTSGSSPVCGSPAVANKLSLAAASAGDGQSAASGYCESLCYDKTTQTACNNANGCTWATTAAASEAKGSKVAAVEDKKTPTPAVAPAKPAEAAAAVVKPADTAKPATSSTAAPATPAVVADKAVVADTAKPVPATPAAAPVTATPAAAATTPAVAAATPAAAAAPAAAAVDTAGKAPAKDSPVVKASTPSLALVNEKASEEVVQKKDVACTDC